MRLRYLDFIPIWDKAFSKKCSRAGEKINFDGEQTIGRDRPNIWLKSTKKLAATDQINWSRSTEQLAAMDWSPLQECVGITRNIPYEVLSIRCKISIVRGTIYLLGGDGWGRDGYEIRDTQDSVLRVAALFKSLFACR
jgi:hypothetical protein